MPCKHLLPVVLTYAPEGRNSLPEHYRSFPQFSIDPEVAATVAETSAPPSAAPSNTEMSELESVGITAVSEQTGTLDSSMQSAVRQKLSVMMNCTYHIQDCNFLEKSVT